MTGPAKCSEASTAGINEAAFCGCVGTAFAYSGPGEASQMDDETTHVEVFAGILSGNLNICLDPDSFFYSSALLDLDLDDATNTFEDVAEQDECADGCQDGPIWEDEWDKLQCEYAIDGWVEPTSFDRAFVQDWLDDSGVNAGSLCSCAAEHMAEFAPTSDGDLYWSRMNGSIDQCQMAIWKRPLP